MEFKIFKDKFSKIIFIVATIGAIVTLIGYVKPIINYANDLNNLVHQYEQINEPLEKMMEHIKQYEEDRTNKKKSFSIGLRSDTETGQVIYVDENNGIYRAFLDEETKQYFYYNVDGVAVYCYTKKPVKGEERHIEIKPIIIPDSVIVDSVIVE
tara:strand:+ start:225 stop:686 length:462 start_codon:yes stop_codon:yes gene_type:complete